MFAAGVADGFSDKAGAFVGFFCEVEAEDAWRLLGREHWGGRRAGMGDRS